MLAAETMMSQAHPQSNGTPEPEDEESDRRLGNIVIVVGLVLLLGTGWWLANALYEARKADDCLSSGRRNCSPIEVPAR
jgi:hypothetical protein